MFKNCRKLFLLVFRNTQLGCQYLPIFDCDKDLSDDLQCNLLREHIFLAGGQQFIQIRFIGIAVD